MSLGIFPVFQRPLIGTKFEGLGEAIAANLKAIESIARSARLTSLAAFGDNRPVPDDFDGDPDDLAEIPGECSEWFDPSEGRAAIHSLAGHIKASPDVARRLDCAGDVVEELEELERVLGTAVTQGVRFRLELS